MPKYSDLTAITGANLAAGDLVDVVDISDTTMAATGTNKKTTLADIAASPPLTSGLTTHEAAADPHTGYVLQSDLETEVDALVTPLEADPSITLSGATIGVNRLVGRVTADLTNVVTNSTTLVDITGLSVTVEAGATYEVRGLLIYAVTAVATAKFGWTVPASTTGTYTILGMRTLASANSESQAKWQSQDYATTYTVGGTTATGALSTLGNRITAFLSGVLTTTNAGTVTLRVAQNTADATALQIGANSYIMLTRIA